ncbi:MAG: 30S ribosomal protein S16 [Bacteroidales bacterium]|nr:30S ribosomal protein S16 [Bacteroidales bacterium]
MPTKIRLQRKGKKAQPFYHIVIADGRAPRDGKYIERIGTYNPLTKPADINLKFDRALYWLQAGAQPTDTVRSILSYKGVLYKNHLLKGIKKGALTQEQADAKFDAWLKEKEEKIAGNRTEIILAEKDTKKKLLEAEKKINEERAKVFAAKRLAELEGEAAKKAEEETSEADVPAEAATESTPVAGEEPKAEEKKEEVKAKKANTEEKQVDKKAE